MQVVIMGSGNVATVLGKKIQSAGHEIIQVYSRSRSDAAVLAMALNDGPEPVDHFLQLSLQADIYLLAVSDGALPGVAADMPGVQGIVVHTAGAVSTAVLQQVSSLYGVLYPLQSLRKEKTDYADIPLLTDGNTAACQAAITAFAQTISNRVAPADDACRLRLHTAAVVVSNFTNHLYALAADFCKKEQIDFSLLQPIIEETATRMRQFQPAQMQTGPAVRGDEATIYRHLQLLEQYPPLQQVYRQLTAGIQERIMDDEPVNSKEKTN